MGALRQLGRAFNIHIFPFCYPHRAATFGTAAGSLTVWAAGLAGLGCGSCRFIAFAGVLIVALFVVIP